MLGMLGLGGQRPAPAASMASAAAWQGAPLHVHGAPAAAPEDVPWEWDMLVPFLLPFWDATQFRATDNIEASEEELDQERLQIENS